MAKLMTDNQGREVARLARTLGVTCAAVTVAFEDKRIKAFLESLVVPLEKSLPVVSSLPTWKTLRTGSVKSVEDFRAACEAKGIQISDWANDLLNKIAALLTTAVEEDVEFVRASNADLGFTEDTTKEDAEKRANELGLLKCKPWDAFAIVLALLSGELSLHEWFLIMMDAITDSRGYPLVFVVERSDVGLWLGAYDGYSGRVWFAGRGWVFRRRKSLEIKP